MQKFKISKLSDIEEIEKMPIQERLPYFNTYDLLKYGTAINPEAKAISFIACGEDFARPMHITYREFIHKVTQTANLFYGLGIGREDVVSIILPNLPEFYYIYWGVQAVGIVNPLNYMLEPSSILNLCRSAKTKILVVLGEEFGEIGAEIWRKVMAIHRDLPGLEAIVRIKGPSDQRNRIYGYEDIIGKFREDALDSKRIIAPQDTSSMLYTGGTTGAPKLAVRSHLNEVCVPFIANLYNGTLTPGETVLGCTPLFHALAPFTSGTFAFSVGGHVVILSPFGFKDPSIVMSFYKIIEHYRAVCLFLVPTMLLMLLDTPLNGADISSFRWVNCGGSPLSEEIIQRWEAKTSVKIVQGYGLTEATSITSMDPMDGERRVGSIGLRMPYIQHEVFILDEKGSFLRKAEQSEVGTICIKGPTVMKGYMDPDHDRRAWAKEKWLNTGDRGRRDPDGYFWLTGRSKELIRRSGNNIDPAIIEDIIYKLEGVQVAAAVPKPDPYAGEVPCLYVQLKGGSNLTKEKIMDYMREHIGERMAVPKEVVIIDEIPLTPVGKIFKPALCWDAVKRAYETALSVLEARVEFYKVDAIEDKNMGMIATVTIKPSHETAGDKIEEGVKEVLAPYSVPYRVEVV